MGPSIFTLSSYFLNIHSLPYFLAGILIIGEGIFVFLQNRKSLLHTSFMLMVVVAGIWLTGVGAFYCAKFEEVALFWIRHYCFFGVIFITPAVYLFSVCWEGTLLKKLKIVIFNFGCALLLYLCSIFSPLFIKGVWKYPWGFYTKSGIINAYFPIWFYMIMALSIINFINVYRKETLPLKRKQATLIIIAFSIAFVGSFDFLPNYGIAIYPIGYAPVFIFITMLGYCVIRYKLMEIETVIHKTIAWFFTSVALIVPLAVFLYITKAWYSKLSPLGTWIYLGGVLLCFLLFVKTFHPKIDHFFQRGRFELENVLNKFSDELVHLRGLEELINKITDTIIDILYASKVTILLYNDRIKKLVTVGSIRDSLKVSLQLDPENPFLKWLSENDRILNREFIEIDPRYEAIRPQAKEYFQRLHTTICIPLILNEKLIGLVNLGRKMNLKPFSSFDFQFLTHLKNQSTIAVSNSLVYDRVEELVKIRTEELVQAQQQLIQAEKLATVGTLAGGVAHEINNPLAAILTNAQMMLMTAENEDDKESLQLMEEAAKRCRSIIQKLMTYSRKPLGGREISNVDLEKALHNVISFLGYQLTQDNVRLNTKLENGPFIVKGSQNELEQVFTNLILNARDAIKRIKKAGEIEISISNINSKITINVKDNGIGISEEHISKIFDPFFTTKDVGKGTGLGLSICQSIVEEHKGSIEVKSQQGQGATFKIQLPAILSHANSKVEQSQ